MDNREVILASYCCHSTRLQNGDAWLIQKLARETEEELFVDTANITPYEGHRLAA